MSGKRTTAPAREGGSLTPGGHDGDDAKSPPAPLPSPDLSDILDSVARLEACVSQLFDYLAADELADERAGHADAARHERLLLREVLYRALNAECAAIRQEVLRQERPAAAADS